MQINVFMNLLWEKKMRDPFFSCSYALVGYPLSFLKGFDTAQCKYYYNWENEYAIVAVMFVYFPLRAYRSSEQYNWKTHVKVHKILHACVFWPI